MTDEQKPGGVGVACSALLGAIDTANGYASGPENLRIVTLRMDEAIELVEAMRRESARLDFIEGHALFIALDGRVFSHCQMGASRAALDAAIAAMTPNAKAQATGAAVCARSPAATGCAANGSTENE